MVMIRAILLPMVLAVLFAFRFPFAASQQETVADLDRLVPAMNALLDDHRYSDAIPYARRVLEIHGQMAGENSGLYAADLYVLGRIYSLVSQHDKAEPLYRKALAIQKQLHGPDSLEYAAALNSLGSVYDDMELYDLAEPQFRDALRIRESKLAPNDPKYTESLNRTFAVEARFELNSGGVPG